MVNKIFRCPKCGMQAPFGQLMPNVKPAQAAQPLKTNIVTAPAGQFSPGGKTHVASKPNIAELVIENSGRAFPIAQGTYTLGRASADSTASLKLAPDPYMSRLHARLDVIPAPGGCMCRITAMSSANSIYVNNTKLQTGQSASLRNNDRILLGMTNVIFRTK